MMLDAIRALQQKPVKVVKKVYKYNTEQNAEPSPRVTLRRKELLQHLKRKAGITSKELSLILSVTETTVRKDIAFLAQSHEIDSEESTGNRTKFTYVKELSNEETDKHPHT